MPLRALTARRCCSPRIQVVKATLQNVLRYPVLGTRVDKVLKPENEFRVRSQVSDLRVDRRDGPLLCGFEIEIKVQLIVIRLFSFSFRVSSEHNTGGPCPIFFFLHRICIVSDPYICDLLITF